MKTTNLVFIWFPLFLLLSTICFSQNDTKEPSLDRRLPVLLDLTVNGHADSIQFVIMTELKNRKYKLIDRTQLNRMLNLELARKIRLPSGGGAFENPYSINQNPRTVAQQLTMEFHINEDSLNRKVDSVSWSIDEIPANVNRPAQRKTLYSPSDLQELLLIMYDRVASVRKRKEKGLK